MRKLLVWKTTSKLRVMQWYLYLSNLWLCTLRYDRLISLIQLNTNDCIFIDTHSWTIILQSTNKAGYRVVTAVNTVQG